MKLLWLLLIPVLATGNCVAIQGPRIMGRDLAAADPQLAEFPSQKAFGFAPAPGRIRVIEPAELLRWARQSGLSLVPRQPICFALQTERLDEVRIVEALRQALPEGLNLRVLDYPKWEVPLGTLEFTVPAVGQLRPDRNDGSRLFRGAVRYGDRLTHPIWARVQLRMKLGVVVASQPLTAGQPIAATQLEIRQHDGFPPAADVATNIAAVAGRVPRRAVAAGSDILLTNLAEPATVRRGDAVEVEVRSGQARLRFTGHAQSSARRGEEVQVENPTSRKRFTAKVVGPGKAVLALGKPASVKGDP